MSKYYLVTVSTPYCGEIEHHTLAIPEDEDINDDKYLYQIDEWLCENKWRLWDDFRG